MNMRTNDLVIVALGLAALIYWPTDVIAQQIQTRCSQISYSTPDAGMRAYRLGRIEGQAVYAPPSQRWELGSANGVCVIVFDRKSKEAFASVMTDDKGQFQFPNLVPGEYTLVASAGELQVISIPIKLVAAKGAGPSRRLLLHLREQQDKRRTFVTPVTRPALRKELIAMAEQDQKIRNEMISGGVNSPSKEVLARMDVIDRRNTSRMKSIIKEYGWPGPGLVGWDGSEAAFFLVQHADHLTQKKFLPLMRREYRAGNFSGPHYALFVDRVLVEDGKLQVYGSRAKPFDQWRTGEPMLFPIEDEANVDKRRAEAGLAPLAEYLESLKRMYYPRGK